LCRFFFFRILVVLSRIYTDLEARSVEGSSKHKSSNGTKDPSNHGQKNGTGEKSKISEEAPFRKQDDF